jgi:isocitrate dehydrogenase
MGREFKKGDDLKDLFESILGSNITLKDTIMADEEALFSLIVNKLDKAHNDDEVLFELTGIDLTKSKNELWFIIEALLKITYGERAFDMIMWYILDRFNPDGKVVPFQDSNGDMYSLLTAKDLYNFLKHRFPPK